MIQYVFALHAVVDLRCAELELCACVCFPQPTLVSLPQTSAASCVHLFSCLRCSKRGDRYRAPPVLFMWCEGSRFLFIQFVVLLVRSCAIVSASPRLGAQPRRRLFRSNAALHPLLSHVPRGQLALQQAVRNQVLPVQTNGFRCINTFFLGQHHQHLFVFCFLEVSEAVVLLCHICRSNVDVRGTNEMQTLSSFCFSRRRRKWKN